MTQCESHKPCGPPQSRDSSHHVSEAKCPPRPTHLPLRHRVHSTDHPASRAWRGCIVLVFWLPMYHSNTKESARILAPLPLRLQKHTDLSARDSAHSPHLWHELRLANCRCAWSRGLRGVEPYHGYFLGGKGGRGVGSTTLPPAFVDCLEIWQPRPTGVHGLSRPAQGLLFFFYASGMLFVTVPKMTLKRQNVNCPRHVQCFQLALLEHELLIITDWLLWVVCVCWSRGIW